MLYSFMTTALEGVEGSALRPGRSLPPGKTQYPFYRRLGEPRGRSGQVRKISPPPGFDPRTVQPGASRYTNYATRLTHIITRCSIICISVLSPSTPPRTDLVQGQCGLRTSAVYSTLNTYKNTHQRITVYFNIHINT